MAKTKKLDLATFRELHQAGQFKQAEAGYLAILRKNPREINALNWLGILYTQQENFANAIHYLQKAVNYYPHDPRLQLNLANVFKLQGSFNQAAQVLKNTLAANPNYIPALNNLGTLSYAEGKLDDAIAFYHQAIAKKPDYVDAYYNLGLTQAKKNLFSAAVDTYQTLLSYDPEHFAARFQLASVLMQQNKIPDALKEFLKIETAHPYHFETQSNLATCYLKQGELNLAKSHYEKALELRRDDTQILFNLGFINTQQGNIDQAIQFYQRTIKINPDFFAAHNNLGVAFIAKQHTGFALHHFQQALRIQPENKALAYTVQMLAQDQPLLSAPPDYVQSLFDAYADHYEVHLLNALDYKIPELFAKLITKLSPPAHSLDILDLGCGTGLCGVQLQSFAKKLVGVDLSRKMLDVAKQKNIYTELLADDVTTFLANSVGLYDLIVAGDVLVYMGELKSIFAAVKKSLRAKGLFIFNTEVSEASHFTMNQSGRFSHQKTYLDALAKENHFNIISYEIVITRMQNNAPVYGHLYALGS